MPQSLSTFGDFRRPSDVQCDGDQKLITTFAIFGQSGILPRLDIQGVAQLG